MKKQRIEVKDIQETSKALGERELQEVELKLVAGGRISQGGTSTTCNDCDQ